MGYLCCAAAAADQHLQAGSGCTSPGQPQQLQRAVAQARPRWPKMCCPAADVNMTLEMCYWCMQLLSVSLSTPGKLYDRCGG